MAAPALVLLHGYPFDHTLWDHVVPLLPDHIQVLAPDLRGFGGPPVADLDPELGRMADDIKILLDQKQIGRAVVAGMSMGGYVALAFAEHYPERLAGLALISSNPWADTEEVRANRRSLIEKVRREGVAVATHAVLPKLFASANSDRPELIRFPTAAANKAGIEGITWVLEAMARRPDRCPVLQSLGVSVLVLHGTEDQFVPVARAREVAGLASHSRFVEVPGAGHGIPLEAPATVAAALGDLLKQSYGDDSH
jgi:pimeloyl-ACP methyl ester carboxylesterase